MLYGVLVDGMHVTVSATANGAKKYAAKHGYETVSELSEKSRIVTRTWVKERGVWIEEDLPCY